MRGRLWFLGGVAVGFVLGARAGRERYDQLVSAARQLWDHPTVQEATGVVQEQANRLYTGSKEAVSEKLSNTKLGEKLARTRDEPGAEPSQPNRTAGAATSANDNDPLASAGRKPAESTS